MKVLATAKSKVKNGSNGRGRGLSFRLALAMACGLLGLLAASVASAQAATILDLTSRANTTAAPGDTDHRYIFDIASLGDEGTPDLDNNNEIDQPIVVEVQFPAGIRATGMQGVNLSFDCSMTSFPTPFGGTVICKRFENPLGPLGGGSAGGEIFLPFIANMGLKTEVAPSASGTETAHLSVYGGGATQADGSPCGVEPPEVPCDTTVDPTRITNDPPTWGIDLFDTRIAKDSLDQSFSQAAGHPYEITSALELNTKFNPRFETGYSWPVESAKDIVADLPPGLVGNPTAAATCRAADLVSVFKIVNCPAASQIGEISVMFDNGVRFSPRAVYNMEPPPGVPARFAFNVFGVIINLDARLRSDSDYGLSLDVKNISQPLALTGQELTIWGAPGAPSHDNRRSCPGQNSVWENGPTCPGASTNAFLTMPTSCTSPGKGLSFDLRTDSWEDPGDFASTSFETHELPGFPHPEEEWGAPAGTKGCEGVPFNPKITVQPTAHGAETPTGLNVSLEIPDAGLLNPDGIAQANLRKAVVSLPEGVTINPSAAEGLGVCSPSEYNRESASSAFGAGCPTESKIGTVQIDTPLLDEPIEGVVYQAQQDDPGTTTPGAENPFDSLLAIYIVAKNAERGIVIKLPGKVQPDANTGQILTTFDDLPQLPFSKFNLKFREGARSLLVTPPTCGTYETEAALTPWSTNEAEHVSSFFQVTTGVNGGSCPSGGTAPFAPGFNAGSTNNDAGSYSPFSMRLTRRDGEQDMTKFSAVLPPGVSAKIAGVSKCPDAAIASAKAKSGRQELSSPSCPANSQIGRIMAGAGVGSVLTYVPGKLYLAGPFAGAPLSVVAITPAVAGPFDVGTVVNREALTLDPSTGQVHVDGDRSDPIPHILQGIPLKIRDIRIYTDRPDFTINPTSCDPFAVAGDLWGSFREALNPADDRAVGVSARYQAADCASLGFKPRLALKLKGGTRRGGHPRLKATYTPRNGDANVKGLVVRLPRSAFLEQAHIRTICTRVQFAADGGNGAGCPVGAVYGHIEAWTPLLDEPLEGPVYLRSSNHKLPDLVFALHGLVDVEVATRIDSVRGGIRAGVENIPDAPLTKVVLRMQGARKGLIVNSRNLCGSRNRAKVEFAGQNGKTAKANPELKPGCGGTRKRHKRHSR